MRTCSYACRLGVHCFPKYLENNVLNVGVSLTPPKSELTGESELWTAEARRHCVPLPSEGLMHTTCSRVNLGGSGFCPGSWVLSGMAKCLAFLSGLLLPVWLYIISEGKSALGLPWSS